MADVADIVRACGLGALFVLALAACSADPITTRTDTVFATEPTSEAAQPSAEPVQVEGPDWADGLVAGVCFDEVFDADADDSAPSRPISCDGPHDHEVYFAGEVSGAADAEWPGFEALAEEIFTTYCADALVNFAGRSIDLLPLKTSAWVANNDEWNDGSRSAVCTVTTVDPNASLIGTAAGSPLGPASTDYIVSMVEGDHGGLEIAMSGPEPGEDGVSLTAQDGGLYDDALAFDGSRIVWFVADPDNDGSRSLMGYSFSSAQIVRITAFDGRDVRNPTVAPDGTVIASAGFADASDTELWGIGTDGVASQLTDTPGLFVDYPSVTPDNELIVFSASPDGKGMNLWAFDRESGELTQLTDTDANDTEPAVAPDGSQIIFTSDRSGNRDVWSIDVDGSNPTNLTSHPGDDSQPTYSLATDRVFFQSNRFGIVDNTLFMLRDGSEQASLTFEGVRSPEVLPLDPGALIYNATFNNQLRLCDVPGALRVTECAMVDGRDLVSVTVHPEPPGAPWPGEDTITERTVRVDCAAALDELFGTDREPREVVPVFIDEELWDFGTRVSACLLTPDQ